jgi:hypothetical protein
MRSLGDGQGENLTLLAAIDVRDGVQGEAVLLRLQDATP